MDNSEQQTETIIRYIDNDMPEEARIAFEHELKNNVALNTEYENMLLAKSIVTHYGLRSQVAGQHSQMMEELNAAPMQNKGGRVVPMLRYSMRIAASLLIFAFAFLMYEFSTVSSKGLLTTQQTYTLSVERGADEPSAIEIAYNKKNYTTVIALFDKDNNATNTDSFLAGQAYLATGRADKAISAFEPLTRTSAETEYHDDAEYYLAISYLQNDQPAKAQPLLVKIHSDKDHLYNNNVTYFTLFKLKLLLLK